MITTVINSDLEAIISEFRTELKSLDGKKILITGANGSIPSYLADVFAKFNKELDKPCKIIAVNKNPITEKSRLSHLLSDENVSFITQDVGLPFQVPADLDIIIHAASRANPALFLKDPIDTINANVNGAKTLLEYCRTNPVKNFLFFSSAEVYGDNPPPEFMPIPENYPGNVDPLSRKACYAESKRFAETLCSAYFKQHSVPAKILRVFHTYGPGMREDGRVITDFFSQARERKEIRIRDRGGAKISFCYVSDLVSGILRVMFSGNSGEAYNIGSDLELPSVRQIAETVGEVMENGTSVFINPDAPESANITARAPDLKKIRALGYSPKVLLREGLSRMKKHYEEIDYKSN